MKEPVRAVAGGIAVGIANVIPGVSGGTMMAIMNIFNRMMDAISGVTKKDNKNRMKDILFLCEVMLGTIIGIIGFSWLVEKLFEYIPMPTVFWFVGLVALSVPVFLKNQMNGHKVHFGGLSAGVILIAILTIVKLVFFPDKEDVTNALPDFSAMQCVILCGAGIVGGFAMLLPGVSGSLMLMILTLYETVYFSYINNMTSSIKNILEALVTSFKTSDFSIFTNVWSSFWANDFIKFIPAGFFAIGVIIGIVLSAKLTKIALAKNERITLSFLLGLVAASAVSVIFLNLNIMTSDIVMILGSVGGFVLGGVIVLLLGKVTSEG